MKKMNKKGFTLMEMLIVVAIIAILIAIAIPTFSSQLQKAKQAADNASVRSAYAEAMSKFLVNASLSSSAAFNDAKGAQAVGNGEKISNCIVANWAVGNQVVVWVDANGNVGLVTGASGTMSNTSTTWTNSTQKAVWYTNN